MRPTLAAVFACLIALLPANPSSSSSTAYYDCEGDACASVALSWEQDGQRFRVDNSSERRVRVTVSSFAGESWVAVGPRASAYLTVKHFRGPYRANFE